MNSKMINSATRFWPASGMNSRFQSKNNALSIATRYLDGLDSADRGIEALATYR